MKLDGYERNDAFARHDDPDTSHIAAATIDASELEIMVLDVVRTFPKGCIADDVEKALPHMRSHSITPRFRPLIRKGFIVETGEKRKAESGRSQRVVLAAEFAAD